MNKDIFKAYDVRGLYGTEITEDTFYAIGHALVATRNLRTVAIGRDARSHSPALFEALTRGITDAGCDVINIGLATTPMVYFATSMITVDGAIALTASHNPPEYNGMKFCDGEGRMIGLENGMRDVCDAVTDTWAVPASKGTITDRDISKEYLKNYTSKANFGNAHFTVAIDTACAMGVLDIPIYKSFSENLKLHTLYDTLDHPFSAHEANPMRPETLDELGVIVRKENADIGIAYDGDGDRIGFTNEKGIPIPMDAIIGLIAAEILPKNPGAPILHDLRCSRSVAEMIEAHGGQSVETPVGNPTIKSMMREQDSPFGGEMSGHYFFQEESYAEASTLIAIYILNAMARTGKKISELVHDAQKYHKIVETNTELENLQQADNAMQRLSEKYSDGIATMIDGVKVSYWDQKPLGYRWWFSVRKSNTEPVLRLNLEADTPELMQIKTEELLACIRSI